MYGGFLLVMARFGARSWFFQDDLFFMQQAREQGLTWRYASGDVFGSFAPLFKLSCIASLRIVTPEPDGA